MNRKELEINIKMEEDAIAGYRLDWQSDFERVKADIKYLNESIESYPFFQDGIINFPAFRDTRSVLKSLLPIMDGMRDSSREVYEKERHLNTLRAWFDSLDNPKED